MGWTGKILRVNLTTGNISTEPLNMEWARKYLGQRGLATKYLIEEIDPKVDPLGPGNKMIFATGPLTGTAASTGGRYSVITKGALTNAIACSNSGGYFGAELKFSGWDMIIFEGRSPKPVYLTVFDDKVEIRDASEIWGMSVWDTDEWIKKKHQDPMMHISAIGVAGENQVLYSCIVNDLHRAAGRSGVGAVMGSKNLKAVAVRGTKGVKVKDGMRFLKATRTAKGVLQQNAVTGAGLPTYGTHECHQRSRRDADPQPSRRAVRRCPRHLGRGDGDAEEIGWPQEPADQPSLLRLHDRLRTHLKDRREALHDPEQATVLARLRRPRVRSRLGARLERRHQRSGSAHLRQLHLQ